jgi:hypothetical protein
MPDVAAGNLCTVTGTFLTADGSYLPGIYVRFSPDLETARVTALGFIGKEATATSNASGQLSLTLIRGLTGLLSITGSDLVRRVTIPDQAAIDIFDLASTGADLLEVQELELVELPRRS